MRVIGLTGGIGSGKSLVAKILQDKYGAYILYTDDIAKEQMEPGGASYQAVVGYFGEGILLPDQRIDRSMLAKIIFEDKDKRLKINELTHPIVLEAVKDEIRSMREKRNVPYLVIETALMIEAGYDYICDEVWYVFAPEEDRRSRLKKDRSYTDEKINSIMENQSKDKAFRKKYPKVIENTGDISFIENQVTKLIGLTNKLK